jgi:hypothetical protein
MGDNYGTRIRGYLYPPVDGPYVFAIAADDSAELWLSTDDSPEKKALVASVETPTKRREWDAQPSQQSSPVTLKGGHVYYVEALHKEGTQNDHVSVGWKPPGVKDIEVITGARLSPFEPAGP